MRRHVDLNCDLGEGAGDDEALMPLITSANIACGAHAGDETSIRIAVRRAIAHGVAIGAHPSFADREHFGRIEHVLPAGEITRLVRDQVATLREIAAAEGAVLRHVKPHGALYNMAARDASVAAEIVDAVVNVDAGLRLFGLAGSVLLKVGRARGLRVAEEVFADRTYQPDGSLMPRSRPGALIHDEGEAVAQVLRMVREGRVRAVGGAEVPIIADTVCLHGDGPRAVAFAMALRSALTDAGVIPRALT